MCSEKEAGSAHWLEPAASQDIDPISYHILEDLKRREGSIHRPGHVAGSHLHSVQLREQLAIPSAIRATYNIIDVVMHRHDVAMPYKRRRSLLRHNDSSQKEGKRQTKTRHPMSKTNVYLNLKDSRTKNRSSNQRATRLRASPFRSSQRFDVPEVRASHVAQSSRRSLHPIQNALVSLHSGCRFIPTPPSPFPDESSFFRVGPRIGE